MARRVAYLVFLIPVVISIPIAAYVLYDIVQQPGRAISMMPNAELARSDSAIRFVGIESAYLVNDPLNIEAEISNPIFDCGDVYITVYDSNNKPVSQNAFFDQCFSSNQSIVPVDGQFSESVGKAGTYQIVLEILDANQQYTESASAVIDVK